MQIKSFVDLATSASGKKQVQTKKMHRLLQVEEERVKAMQLPNESKKRRTINSFDDEDKMRKRRCLKDSIQTRVTKVRQFHCNFPQPAISTRMLLSQCSLSQLRQWVNHFLQISVNLHKLSLSSLFTFFDALFCNKWEKNPELLCKKGSRGELSLVLLCWMQFEPALCQAISGVLTLNLQSKNEEWKRKEQERLNVLRVMEAFFVMQIPIERNVFVRNIFEPRGNIFLCNDQSYKFEGEEKCTMSENGCLLLVPFKPDKRNNRALHVDKRGPVIIEQLMLRFQCPDLVRMIMDFLTNHHAVEIM